ncbi:hypothetical protein [Aerophototrophica crusticola]
MTMPLTRDMVIEICGPMDDFRIASIIGTGVTPAQLTEAKGWMAADDVLGGTLGKRLDPSVARLIELLRADEAEWDDR